MSIRPIVVARRYMEGGTLQVPPLMLRDISDWAFSVILESRREYLLSQPVMGADDLRDLEEAPSTLKYLAESLRVKVIAKKPKSSWDSYQMLLKYLRKFKIDQPTPIDRKDFLLFLSDGSLWNHLDADIYSSHRRLDLILNKENKFRANLSAQLGAINREQKVRVESALHTMVEKQFPVDTQGWSYPKFQDLGKFLPELNQKYRSLLGPMADLVSVEGDDGVVRSVDDAVSDAVNRWRFITVRVIPGHSAEGSWNPTKRILSLRLPPLVSSFAHLMFAIDKTRDEVNVTIRHELQHMVQTYLAFALGGLGSETERPFGRGFPTRKQQTPLYRQELDGGRVPSDAMLLGERGKALRSLMEQGIEDPSKISLHALDDVEFHTRMEDSKHDLKTLLDRACPPLDPKRVFRIFSALEPAVKDYSNPYAHIQPDIFMQTLARVPSARAKYRRALTELSRVVR